MQVRCFYSESIPEAEEAFELSADEARHAAGVLRLTAGDLIRLTDGRGCRAEARVVEVTRPRHPQVLCRIETRTVVEPPSPAIRLYVAPPRGKTMNLVLRSATELGVTRITPILCHYGVSRPDKKGGGKAVWRSELVAALKQSGNPFLPVLDGAVPFDEALRNAEEPGVYGHVPEEEGKHGALPPDGAVGVWVGPEGGFSDQELLALQTANFAAISVGPWVLRVETAVTALLAWVHGHIENTGTLL
ncbi:MAG: 16S rRNA (uracil(1498)-N(3))-methyltransferase [Lentisphaeria bacterium]|nr:16S rRNA (uracil(1498)-N(3))-methyltransferase [Lentisphaeria bacterium]